MQVASVPWLRGYVQGIDDGVLLASDLDTGAILDRMRSAATAVGAGLGGEGAAWSRRCRTRPSERSSTS